MSSSIENFKRCFVLGTSDPSSKKVCFTRGRSRAYALLTSQDSRQFVGSIVMSVSVFLQSKNRIPINDVLECLIRSSTVAAPLINRLNTEDVLLVVPSVD